MLPAIEVTAEPAQAADLAVTPDVPGTPVDPDVPAPLPPAALSAEGRWNPPGMRHSENIDDRRVERSIPAGKRKDTRAAYTAAELKAAEDVGKTPLGKDAGTEAITALEQKPAVVLAQETAPAGALPEPTKAAEVPPLTPAEVKSGKLNETLQRYLGPTAEKILNLKKEDLKVNEPATGGIRGEGTSGATDISARSARWRRAAWNGPVGPHHAAPDHAGDGQGIRGSSQDRRRATAGDPTRRAAGPAVESTGRSSWWPIAGAARSAIARRRGAAGRGHLTAVAGASGITGRRDRHRRHHAGADGVFSTPLLDAAVQQPTIGQGNLAPFSWAAPMNWGWGGSSGGSGFGGIYSGGAAFDFGGGGGMVMPEMSAFGG